MGYGRLYYPGLGSLGMSDNPIKNGGFAYQAHPETTQYVSSDRFTKPKEDFKKICSILDDFLDSEAAYKIADIGCGNGELLYLLHRKFPRCELYGFDHTKEFIETAKNFPGLEGVVFSQTDLFEVSGKFDVVMATCFLSFFPDIQKPLSKLLALCRDGGYVLATGLFNQDDIEVRVQFCDNTRESTRDYWRTDFNRHSRASIKRMFGDQVKQIRFEECTYDISIPRNPEHPIRVWSVRDEQGRTLLINGAWQIANQTLLVIHK
jgi:SAM-dependent methyltransferase